MAKADWCPRQTFYRLTDTPQSDAGAVKFSFQLESIFEEGHRAHAKWQRWVADLDQLWGLWGCEHCGHTWYDTAPEGCPACECGCRPQYREVPLNAEKTHLIVGQADMAVLAKRVLGEVKTIGLGTLRFEAPELLAEHTVETLDGRHVPDLDRLWAGIHRPLPSHLRQGNLYLALAQLCGYDFDRMVFLYEFKATQAYKEFVVSPSRRIWEPLFEKALEVKNAVEGVVPGPPPRPEHVQDHGPESRVCVSCPWRTRCWELHTAGQPGRRVVRRRNTAA